MAEKSQGEVEEIFVEEGNETFIMLRCRSSPLGGGPAFGPCWVMPS